MALARESARARVFITAVPITNLFARGVLKVEDRTRARRRERGRERGRERVEVLIDLDEGLRDAGRLPCCPARKKKEDRKGSTGGKRKLDGDRQQGGAHPIFRAACL